MRRKRKPLKPQKRRADKFVQTKGRQKTDLKRRIHEETA